MDWITQGKYVKWLIGILLVVNIVTISIIWVLIMKRKEPPGFDNVQKPPRGIEMMKKEIGLSEDQANQFEKLFKANFEKTKLLFEQIDANKILLSKEFANDKTDTVLINSLTYKIGLIMGEVEKQRINHFKELISLCKQDQKVKLRNILVKIMGVKPPPNGGSGMGPMEPGGNPGSMNLPPPREHGGGPKPFDGPGF